MTPNGDDSGGHRQEELDRILREMQEGFRRRGIGRILLLALGAVVVIALLVAAGGAFYTVDVQENAIVFRFGKYLEEPGVVGPGLHTKVPFIDRVYTAKVEEVKKEEFGFRTIRAGIDSTIVQDPILALTGDLNLVNLQWVVRYKIRDLPDYVINIANVPATVRDVSRAVMLRVVGNRSVDEALTVGREEIQAGAQDEMQKLLDDYGAGIQIVTVRLKETAPPEQVSDAFDEVNRAQQEKDRLIQEAEGERNRVIPAARGQRDRVISEAEGYKIQKVNRAEGDVKEFEAVLERYRTSEEITRKRLYLETMATVFKQAGMKYVVEGDDGVLKLLPLEGALGKGVGQ